MNKLLSQDEVDALLKGLDTGDIESEQKTPVSKVDAEAFDWANKETNIRGSMPLLEVINSRFCQKFKGTLSSGLRKLFDIIPDQMETIKFSDFQRSLPVPTSMHLFKMEPLRGMGILVIESRLVFSLVEAFFGGSGTGSAKIEGRDFTPIEKRVIEKVVQMALSNLTDAWEETYPMRTEYVRSESNPLVVNVVPPEEPLVSVKFEVELNKPLGKILLCIPISSFQPIRQKLAGGYLNEESKQDLTWVNYMKERLMPIEMELTVLLGQSSLSVKELQGLKPGDIILLDNNFKEPLTASIEGIPKYEGYVGRRENRKVFKVEQPLYEEG